MKPPTIYTAARGGPFFKKGCRRCGHAESKHHVEYVAYCDDCPEAVNEGYHEYVPQPKRKK